MQINVFYVIMKTLKMFFRLTFFCFALINGISLKDRTLSIISITKPNSLIMN